MMKKALLVFLSLLLLLSPALAMARQYLIEDSNTRQLTRDELWQWDYETLMYILDEIFARYGFVFVSGGEYEAYFLQRPWYTPNTNPDNQTQVYDKCNAVEWYNERLIKDVRQEMRDTQNYNTGGLNWRDVIGEDIAGELNFIYTYFKGDQKFDVYSAPSTASWRGANGRAAVSTNGPVYVAGWESGWLLVMYDTNAGAVRVGCIRGSGVGSIDAEYLDFAYTTATVSRSVSLTDDPVTGSTAIVTLSSGKQVTYLASYTNYWAYIETTVGSQTVRGFIPENAIR